MSLATYCMHLIFASIPSLVSSDIVLYIIPVLSILILLYSFKVMFLRAPNLRKVRS